MSIRSALLLSIVIAGFAGRTAQGQSSYPMIMDVSPLAVQAGQTSVCEISSRYGMDGAYRVWVNGEGVSCSVVEPEQKPEPLPDAKAKPENPKAEQAKEGKKEATKEVKAEPAKKTEQTRLQVKFTVAADALPGLRDFRVATPRGVSTLGQVVVVRDPVVRETSNNDTLASATSIPLPIAICGAIEKNEDVDHFRFHATAGQALTFQCRAARCEDRIHDLQVHVDPILTLKNTSGTKLAVSDNYFFADPLLHYRFEKEGDYYLEVRDVRFQGNQYWQYCIEINDRPLVTNVYPLGIVPERPTTVELIGFNLPARKTVSLTVPGQLADGPQWIELPLVPPATPAPVVLHHLPPIDELADHQSIATAQPITLPAGVNGRIGRPGELDYYAFEAKKGDRCSFEVVARRHQSGLDPILAVLNEKGARLQENDDFAASRYQTADSQIEPWTAPADGRYFVEVRDLNLAGGKEFVYLLKATRSEPYFVLDLDTDKSELMRGAASTLFVRLYRKNSFTGEVQLSIEGVPKGVAATCGRILDGATDGVIVLEAAPDAPFDIQNVRVFGTASLASEGKSRVLRVAALPLEEVYMPGGGRGLFPVDVHTVSVGEPLDLTAVKVSTANVVLKPGGSQKIDVTIARAPGFDKNVTLDVMSRHLGGIFGNTLPPGVTLDEKNSKTLLTGAQTTGSIVLVAAADAKPVEKQVVPVVANVALNFVMKMAYAAEPVFVTVESK